MKQTTGQNYRQRLTQVIDYVYNNLDGDLSVNALADVAIMSPYHFHRIYRGLAKEPINATIRRLRLQHAAAELIRSTQPIADIAKKVSYGSQEAFSRAFTLYFGERPREYRESRQTNGKACIPYIAMLPTDTQEYTNMFETEIKEFEAINLVGYKHQGDYMNIGGVFEKLFIYAGSHGLLDEGTRSIGLYYGDPQSTPIDELRSMACVTANVDDIPDEADAPEAMQIPAGKYATLLFKGSYAELEKPYSWLFGQWLPQSGYEAADFPPFEEYLNDPKETPPSELLTRIHCKLV
jgi:AraC family transcriptional regulator